MNPPKHLNRDSKILWRKLIEEFTITDTASLVVLQSMLEARERAEAARKIVETEGLTVTNPETGSIRSHPCCVVERDAKSSMLAAARALKLEVDA
jgi:P27 family predicted phage terminase small subunit